jgi:uncharacterized protein (UPF0333 family)
MKKIKIMLLIGSIIVIGVGGCEMKEDYTKDTEEYIDATGSNKTNDINKSFLGKWFNENTGFEVTIKKSDYPQKVSLNFSEDDMGSGDDLKANMIQKDTIDVFGANKDIIYSFTLNDDETLSFSTSSNEANAEKIPSASAPVILKRDYSK